MSDATTQFFEELGTHSNLQVRRPGSSIRFDLRDGDQVDRWRVTTTGDGIDIKHRGGAADCVVRADRSAFDQIVTGRANAMAAMLRGALVVEGDPMSLFWLQKLFPGPPSKGAKAAKAEETKERA